MSQFLEVQTAVAAALREWRGFPAQLEILARREKEAASDIDAALGKFGICLYVMPPLPRSAVRTANDIVFFGSMELRVRVIEQPKLNVTETDAWDMMEQVILALQGTNPGKIFETPIGLLERPLQAVEDKTTRIFDVLFDAAFQLNP